ncbi:DsbA family protein [Aurantimonas sp. A3-2-R12]|uniref:DsbA family protein n=1 Tax=Aurantimonas sp. A3-2-R12 TaxID=3114362 RepID=UPI002E17F26D|nr:DsbA family protein [Aurantimonas sp. A3-2-R12]
MSSATSRRTLAFKIAALLASAGLVASTGGLAQAASASAEAATEIQVAQSETAPATPPAPTVEAPASSGSVDVSKLMAEGPLPDIIVGDPEAPVTIVEYASMTCGHCANFHVNSLPQLKKDFIDTGKAKLIIREFPFDPRALAGAMLARCTGDDAKRTAMVDVLLEQQGEWARAENASAALLKFAKLAGMSQDDFTACLNDKELQQKVVETQERGQNEFGVNATPTFFVNGDKYSGALGPDEMAAVIESHL